MIIFSLSYIQSVHPFCWAGCLCKFFFSLWMTSREIMSLILFLITDKYTLGIICCRWIMRFFALLTHHHYFIFITCKNIIIFRGWLADRCCCGLHLRINNSIRVTNNLASWIIYKQGKMHYCTTFLTRVSSGIAQLHCTQLLHYCSKQVGSIIF